MRRPGGALRGRTCRTCRTCLKGRRLHKIQNNPRRAMPVGGPVFFHRADGGCRPHAARLRDDKAEAAGPLKTCHANTRCKPAHATHRPPRLACQGPPDPTTSTSTSTLRMQSLTATVKASTGSPAERVGHTRRTASIGLPASKPRRRSCRRGVAVSLMGRWVAGGCRPLHREGRAPPGARDVQMQRPPSTSMHTPVTMLASSLHK